MKLINEEKDEHGRRVFVTETKRFLRKPLIRKFVVIDKGFGMWDFLELPDKTIVGDYTSFQLEAWRREP